MVADIKDHKVESAARTRPCCTDRRPWTRLLYKRRLWLATLAAGLIAAVIAIAVTLTRKHHNPSSGPGSLSSDLTVLLHNDLYGNMSPLKEAAILVSKPSDQSNATKDCNNLGESLLTLTPGYNYTTLLGYMPYRDPQSAARSYWVSGKDGDLCKSIDLNGTISATDCSALLPFFCSQSAPLHDDGSFDTSDQWRIDVPSGSAIYKGYRDRRSFRFFGLRYAPQPERFAHSTVYEETKAVDALEAGSECMQSGNRGSEDCLFLNIWTPYLPFNGLVSTSLKPVIFWIHGGAFEIDSGGDVVFDGGNLASRGDTVIVTVNYRLGSLGFLSLEGTAATGNWGLGDQVTALDWLHRHVRDFGGDPTNITIVGQSAGAASVRALLDSPKASGKFAGAIMQSNLAGFGWGGTFSYYPNLTSATERYTLPALNSLGCAGAKSRLDCLKSKKATDFVSNGPQASSLVKDDIYIQHEDLALNRSTTISRVPVILGTMRDDSILFIPKAGNTNLTDYLADYGLDTALINGSSAFSNIITTANNSTDLAQGVYNASAEIIMDAMFRCLDQATAVASRAHNVFPGFWYYEFDRAHGGYPDLPQCRAPIIDDYPNGDPNEPYRKCHSGDLPWVFGNLVYTGLPIRDDNDMLFQQYIVDMWTQFAWHHDPNPDMEYLRARGYTNTTNMINQTGRWPAISGAPNDDTGLVKRLLSANSTNVQFTAREQCEALGYSFDYYS